MHYLLPSEISSRGQFKDYLLYLYQRSRARLSAFSTALTYMYVYTWLYIMSYTNIIYLTPCKRILYKTYDKEIKT